MDCTTRPHFLGQGRYEDWTYVLAAANRSCENVVQESTQLVVADDHAQTRQALAAWLAATDISIVGATHVDPAVINLIRQRRPDVVLLDLTSANGAGTETLQRIVCAHPDLAVVVHSRTDNPADMARALALGASGYLSWGATRRRYVQCLRVAASGQAAWTRRDLDRILSVLAAARAAGRLPALMRRFGRADDEAARDRRLRDNAMLLLHHAVGLAEQSVAQDAVRAMGVAPAAGAAQRDSAGPVSGPGSFAAQLAVRRF